MVDLLYGLARIVIIAIATNIAHRSFWATQCSKSSLFIWHVFFFSLPLFDTVTLIPSISIPHQQSIMGKQTRKSFKPRTNPLGSRIAAGVQEGINEQQMTLQPDQVLPVVDKVRSTMLHSSHWTYHHCYNSSHLLMQLREVGLLLVFPIWSCQMMQTLNYCFPKALLVVWSSCWAMVLVR